MEISAPAALIDLFFLILCLGIIYISVSKGILQEGFKVVGILVAALLAFQYYSFLGNIIHNKISFLNKQYLYFFSFLLIFLVIKLIFNLLRLIITQLFKLKEISIGEKWMASFLGIGRAAFLSSIIFFLLYLLSFNPHFYNKSISYRVFKNIAPGAYLMSFGIYKKFNPQGEPNKEVEEYYEVKQSLPGNSEEGH